MTRIASHTCRTSTDALCPKTIAFFRTLIAKSGHFLTEYATESTRTFYVNSHATFTPDSDATREREDVKGESYEPGCHALQPLEAQRESAGLTYSETADDEC